MNAATKTRTQRRMEKKQALILLVLVLVTSLASFTLGVVIGRRGAERDLALKQQTAERILVTPSSQGESVDAPEVADTDSAEVAESAIQPQEDPKLTFYDNLAKEDAAPLGSGINLPPKPKVESKPVLQPPIPLPAQPIVKKSLPVTVAKVDVPTPISVVAPDRSILPKSDPRGTYAVQVGSFSSAGDAGALKKRLSGKGFPVFVVEADLGAKGLWYRVRLGPYADGANAKIVQQAVEENEKIKGFVSRQ